MKRLLGDAVRPGDCSEEEQPITPPALPKSSKMKKKKLYRSQRAITEERGVSAIDIQVSAQSKDSVMPEDTQDVITLQSSHISST